MPRKKRPLLGIDSRKTINSRIRKAKLKLENSVKDSVVPINFFPDPVHDDSGLNDKPQKLEEEDEKHDTISETEVSVTNILF